MNRLKLLTACGLLLALQARAELDQIVLQVTYGTNATVTLSATNAVKGYLEQIDLDIDSAGSTGDLNLVLSPPLASLSDVTLVGQTNLASDAQYRPALDYTDTAGAALTSDPPGRYPLIGTLVFSCTNSSATGVTYRCVVTFDK